MLLPRPSVTQSVRVNQFCVSKVIDCPAGPRGKIPPSFAYLHIDVALERGFAHVIEDPRLFPTGFGRSILYDILEADRFTKAYTSSEER